MEVQVYKENLQEHDTGGGYRTVEAHITIDNTMTPRMQRGVLIYECLGAMLDCTLTHEQLEHITDTLNGALDQLI